MEQNQVSLRGVLYSDVSLHGACEAYGYSNTVIDHALQNTGWRLRHTFMNVTPVLPRRSTYVYSYLGYCKKGCWQYGKTCF